MNYKFNCITVIFDRTQNGIYINYSRKKVKSLVDLTIIPVGPIPVALSVGGKPTKKSLNGISLFYLIFVRSEAYTVTSLKNGPIVIGRIFYSFLCKIDS